MTDHPMKRCLGPWPACGHADNTCTACPAYQFHIKAAATTDCEGSSVGMSEANAPKSTPRGEGTEAATRIRAAIADLAGEAEAMSGGFDPENWSVEVKVTDLQAILAALSSAQDGSRPQAVVPTVGHDAGVVGLEEPLSERLVSYLRRHETGLRQRAVANAAYPNDVRHDLHDADQIAAIIRAYGCDMGRHPPRATRIEPCMYCGEPNYGPGVIRPELRELLLGGHEPSPGVDLRELGFQGGVSDEAREEIRALGQRGGVVR